MMNKWNSWARTGFLLCIVLAVLTACTSGGESVQPTALSGHGSKEEVTLKVTFWDEEIFYQRYGSLFAAKHPNIQFEVVPTDEVWMNPEKNPRELIVQLVKDQKPDVIMLEPYLLAPLIEEGLLHELDVMMQRDNFTLDGVLPAAIDQLRRMGGGRLYGLAPAFMEDAIYYNADLFDQYGVPYPHNGMTWDDLLMLAQRFPTNGSSEDRVYGLQLYTRESGADLMLRSGIQSGLQITDPHTGKMTLSSQLWVRTAEEALRYAKSDAVYQYDPLAMNETETYKEMLRQDLFLTKRIAMKVADSYYMSQIRSAQNTLQEEIIANWDVVTAPTSPEAPNQSASFYLPEVYAVNAQSEHAQAAWEFVKYVNSEEFARLTSRSSVLNGLPVRTDYIRNEEGIQMEAFYTHSPAQNIGNHYLEELQQLPQSFVMSFYESLLKHWDAMLKGETTIEDALLMIESESQHALDEAVNETEEREAEF
jgi:multiple sugar transport system substrate-binding protein